jgi:type 1 glutamine amidotransferase
MTTPVLANLICGSPARNHDFDFARIRLAQALYQAGDIRTDSFNNYDDAEAIARADVLVSYTSQVPVADENCDALREFLERGGRWFAIHASNSVKDNPHLPGILGSRFITHPTYRHFPVAVNAPKHPLLQGIAPFEVDDEIYVIDHSDDIEVLLSTRWGGEALGGRQVEEGERPLMYLRPVGAGGVLYMALGHCNRPFDTARPGMVAPDLRGPWEMPVYKELVRRGIAWAAKREGDI